MSADLLDIQKQGANARALGRSELDNPWMRTENLPASTGETAEAWQEKLQAWELGFKLESAIRNESL